jgi:hypothetical protein
LLRFFLAILDIVFAGSDGAKSGGQEYRVTPRGHNLGAMVTPFWPASIKKPACDFPATVGRQRGGKLPKAGYFDYRPVRREFLKAHEKGRQR